MQYFPFNFFFNLSTFVVVFCLSQSRNSLSLHFLSAALLHTASLLCLVFLSLACCCLCLFHLRFVNDYPVIETECCLIVAIITTMNDALQLAAQRREKGKKKIGCNIADIAFLLVNIRAYLLLLMLHYRLCWQFPSFCFSELFKSRLLCSYPCALGALLASTLQLHVYLTGFQRLTYVCIDSFLFLFCYFFCCIIEWGFLAHLKFSFPLWFQIKR